MQLEAAFAGVLSTLTQVSAAVEEAERDGSRATLLTAKARLNELDVQVNELAAQNAKLSSVKDTLVAELLQSITRNAELAKKLGHLAQIEVSRNKASKLENLPLIPLSAFQPQ